jgi:hypothetical protein
VAAPCPSLRLLYLRIAPSRFAWLKNILEGYDNLAVVSRDAATPHGALVRYPSEREREIFAVLSSLAPTLWV